MFENAIVLFSTWREDNEIKATKMAGKKKAENFMKDVTTEKEWESLCDYQVN